MLVSMLMTLSGTLRYSIGANTRTKWWVNEYSTTSAVRPRDA